MDNENPTDLTEEQKAEIIQQIQASGIGGYHSRYMVARMKRRMAKTYTAKARKHAKVRCKLEKAGRRSNRGNTRKR